MQTPMFVFAGLRDQRSFDDTAILLAGFNEEFAAQSIPINFTRDDELLTSEFGDAGFYIAFMKDKSELKDWLKLAKDFQLTAASNPINEDGLTKAIEQKKFLKPGLYSDQDYSIARTIFIEMDKFSPIKIYFFH